MYYRPLGGMKSGAVCLARIFDGKCSKDSSIRFLHINKVLAWLDNATHGILQQTFPFDSANGQIQVRQDLNRSGNLLVSLPGGTGEMHCQNFVRDS